MVFEFLDSLVEVREDAAVARQDEAHVEHVDFVQIVEIIAEGIALSSFVGDVGCDVAEDMVAGEEDFLVLFVKAHVPEGVSGCRDAFEGVFADMEFVALTEDSEFGVFGRAVFEAGMILGRFLYLVFGKPVQTRGDRHSGLEVALSSGIAQKGGFDFVVVDKGGVCRESRNEAHVVGMKMGDEEIRRFEVETQFFVAGAQYGLAFFAIHSRIDDEISFIPFDGVGIDTSKWVPGKGHFYPEQVWSYFFNHLRTFRGKPLIMLWDLPWLARQHSPVS